MKKLYFVNTFCLIFLAITVSAMEDQKSPNAKINTPQTENEKIKKLIYTLNIGVYKLRGPEQKEAIIKAIDRINEFPQETQLEIFKDNFENIFSAALRENNEFLAQELLNFIKKFEPEQQLILLSLFHPEKILRVFDKNDKIITLLGKRIPEIIEEINLRKLKKEFEDKEKLGYQHYYLMPELESRIRKFYNHAQQRDIELLNILYKWTTHEYQPSKPDEISELLNQFSKYEPKRLFHILNILPKDSYYNILSTAVAYSRETLEKILNIMRVLSTEDQLKLLYTTRSDQRSNPLIRERILELEKLNILTPQDQQFAKELHQAIKDFDVTKVRALYGKMKSYSDDKAIAILLGKQEK